MKAKFWQAYQFIKYLFRCIHLHGIHSPFVFNIHQDIFKAKTKYYAFEEIESIRAKLLLTEKVIDVKDLGAGSRSSLSNKRSVKHIAETALKKPKKAQLLFRFIHYFKPTCILELGTSLGITTAYLAKANSKSDVFTVEGSPEIAKIARVNFKKLKVQNVEQSIGNFDDLLANKLKSLKTVDFVFFDGNHQKTPTLNYFESCLQYKNENSIFVFDDIYWSKEMTEAWQEIKTHPEVTVSIDCFEMGFIFFKKDQAKEHFTVYH